MHAIIDLRFYMSYASYYVYGLCQLGDVIFKEIDDISVTGMEEYRKGVAIIIYLGPASHNNVFIDFNDSNVVNEKYYDWSDVYAKVNTHSQSIGREKLLSIGPFMGLTIWNPIKTLYMAFSNFWKWKSDSFKVPIRKYLLDYAYTFVRRCKYEVYTSEYTEDPDYVFAISTLWYDEETYNTTNKLRGDFVAACKELYTEFEGGFFYINSPAVIKQFPKYQEYLTCYNDLLTTKRIPVKQYMEKTKRSAIVFSTDAVAGSFGWKLTEYLALGKCIISTPIGNIMPGEFKAGVHYYEVHNAEEIHNAVSFLRNHHEIRYKLGKNARKYFDEYIAPEKVINRIIERIKEL